MHAVTQPTTGYRRHRNMHTVIVPPEIWQAARQTALETGTSVSAVVSTYLAEFAGLAPRRLTCQWCGTRFVAGRRTAKYCTPEHRWRAAAEKKPTTRAGRRARARA